MRSLIALAVVAVLCCAPLAQAADWAVLVAGSNTYGNYRHQADTAHAYQIVHKNGIPPQNIITFMYDDIANDPSNPFPGKLFNKPTAAGTPGVDVYANIQKDYTGANVTPEMFLAVLKGNSSYPGATKVLQSTANDRVFIFFTDHGATGLIAFPSEYLYATDLNNALIYMSQNKMFNRLVFYIEACESGSMFAGVLPSNIGIYATTASNPDESSWGTYCPPQDMVNGVELNSCLGDLYSVNWMENADSSPLSETLQQQFLIVQNLTTQSHVMQYGDLSWTSEAIGDYIGEGSHHRKVKKAAPASEMPASTVNVRDIPMHLAYYKYLRAERRSSESKAALAELRRQLDAREAAEERFEKLAHLFSLDHKGAIVHQPEHLFNTPKAPIRAMSCVKSAVEALRQGGCDYDDFSLQFHRVIVNACHLHSSEESATRHVLAAIQQVCPVDAE